MIIDVKGVATAVIDEGVREDRRLLAALAKIAG